MALTSCILIFGHDGMLLDTRRWVLESVGFEVKTVSAMPDVVAAVVSESPDLVVLCHTLTADERRATIAAAAKAQPAPKTLAICSNRQEAGEEGISGETLDSLAGAQKLIAAARKVLG